MRSIVKANGDVIKQWELVAVLGADRALNSLLCNLYRRLAAGARIQRGRYDVEVEDFRLGKLDTAGVERTCFRPVGGYSGGIEIETAAKVAAFERFLAKPRAAASRKTAKRGTGTPAKAGARK